MNQYEQNLTDRRQILEDRKVLIDKLVTSSTREEVKELFSTKATIKYLTYYLSIFKGVEDKQKITLATIKDIVGDVNMRYFKDVGEYKEDVVERFNTVIAGLEEKVNNFFSTYKGTDKIYAEYQQNLDAESAVKIAISSFSGSGNM